MKEQYAGLVAEIAEMVSENAAGLIVDNWGCLLYTSPSPRD